MTMVDAPAPETSESAQPLETVTTNSPAPSLDSVMEAARAAAMAPQADDGSTVEPVDSASVDQQPSETSSVDPSAGGEESKAGGPAEGTTGTDPSSDSGQPRLSRKEYARQRDGQQPPAEATADQGADPEAEIERRAEQLYQQRIQREQSELEERQRQQQSVEQRKESKSKARALLLDPATKKDLTERSARFETTAEEGDRLAKGLEMQDFYDLMIDDSRVDALAAISADLGQEAARLGMDPVAFGANQTVADIVRFIHDQGQGKAAPRITELEATIAQRDQRIATLEASLAEARHGNVGTGPAAELGGAAPQSRPIVGRLGSLLGPDGLPSDDTDKKARAGLLTNYFNQP